MLNEIIGIIGILAYLIGFFWTYAKVKNAINPELLLDLGQELLESSLKNIKDDPEMQQNVYAVGLLIGNGIKNGVGLQKGKGKFKFEDLIMQGIGSLFGNMIPTQQQTPQNPNDAVSGTVEKLFK